MFAPLRTEDPRQISGYQLRARLGAGGMGQVYLSATPGGRPVALKLIRADLADDADFRRRFGHEVQAAQRVNGVYTAQLLDADPLGATPWLATAYVAGPSLGEAIRDHGPLPPGTVRALVAAVALSLQAIHAAGVVHRDLKPQNIMLAADGPRVIDFGIARAFDATHLTVSATPIGTPGFMSPEQANGDPVGPSADLFALGSVAYFAATGRSAFGEGHVLTVLRRIAEAQADLTGCPPELRPLVEACLQRDPARRPTAGQLVELCGGVPQFVPGWLPPPVMAGIEVRTRQLATLLNAPPPPAPTEAAVQRPRRWRLVAAIVAVVLGIAAGSAVTAALIGSSPGKGAGADAPGTTAGSTTPAKTSTTTTAQPTKSPSPSVKPEQWSGTVRITGNGINLDPVPPKVGDNGLDSDNDVRLSGINDEKYMDIAADDPNLALWTGDTPPTAQLCADLVSTQGVKSVRLLGKGNEVVCVKTGEKRMATLAVQNLATSFGQGFTAQATIWPA